MSYDYDYYDEFLEEEWLESLPRDDKIDKAKEELTIFFKENYNQIYYSKQLEVLFEKRYFHWITNKAINELIEDGLLRNEEVPLIGNTIVKFVFNKRLRYNRMQIRKSIDVIRKYSDPNIAMACGRQAEVLFFNALTNRGFFSKGQNIKEHKGKKWFASDHDLDFILEKDDTAYGCEVKNKWAYIDKDELEIKIEICKYLKIKPLFIMRHSPKSYNWVIIQNGGYAMIFETQIYPFGQRSLVGEIKEVLGLPADCPRAIPEGIIDRFTKWHEKQRKL